MRELVEVRESLRTLAAAQEGALAVGLSQLATEEPGSAPLVVVVADEHRDRSSIVAAVPEHLELLLPDPPGRDAGAWVQARAGAFVRATWVVGVVTARQLLSRREREMLRAVFRRAPGRGVLVVLELDGLDERADLLARARRFAADLATVVEPADLAFDEHLDWEEGWRTRAGAALDQPVAAVVPATRARRVRLAVIDRDGPPPLEVAVDVRGLRIAGVHCPRLPWLGSVLCDLSAPSREALEVAALERIGSALPADVRADLEVRISMKELS